MLLFDLLAPCLDEEAAHKMPEGAAGGSAQGTEPIQTHGTCDAGHSTPSMPGTAASKGCQQLMYTGALAWMQEAKIF